MSKPKEIKPLYEDNGLSIEKMVAMFFDSNALREPTRQLYRFDKGGYRYYYYFDENQEPVFYESTTTVIQNALPMAIGLLKYYAEKGWAEAVRHRDERALFGTLMHTLFAKYLINKTYNLDTLEAETFEYMEKNHVPLMKLGEWTKELKKAMLGFAQFIIDYEVEPLAIEITLASDSMRVAGTCDLPCMMTIKEKGFWGELLKSGPNKGDPKATYQSRRVAAMIDFKSGEYFYEAHEIQLEVYARMWNETFPDGPQIEKLYNWGPSDWRNQTPTYHLKDQTDSPNIEKLDHILAISHIESKKKKRDITIIKGQLNLGESVENNVQCMKFADIVKKVKKKQEKKARSYKSRIKAILLLETPEAIYEALKGETSIRVKHAGQEHARSLKKQIDNNQS